MNNQKPENKAAEHEDADHTQPINLVAARTPVTTFSGSSTASVTQPVRTHLEPKPGVMTLYFRTPTPRPQGQVMTPVGAQVSSSQHFASKPGTDFKNAHSFTVIRMPASDITQAQVGTTTSSTCGALTPGLLPSALSSSSSRHIIPAVHPVIAAGNTGPSMASIIRGSQVSPAGHVIHPPFSSHVPRGPAAVASISAAPKSAVATPILRTPHSSATISSSSMMALHTPVRTKSPTVSRTATPPVASTSLPQVVDLQKSSIGHSMPSNTSHVGLASRTIDGSIVRTGTAHSSAITIAKPINISQPIVQHLQQVYDKGNLKTMSSLVASTSAPTNSSPAHQTVVPGSFSSVSESVGVVPTISRSTVSTGYSTSIMQLSSAATVGQPLQQLRATHVPQAIHTLSNVNSSVTPHQTLTVISAKSLVPANHSIALASSAPRATAPSATVSTSGSNSIIPGPIRPLNISNSISPSTIPVAKVYPQSTTAVRSNNESSSTNTQENNRTNFTSQPVSNAARVATPTTSSSSVPQTVMLSENKIDSGSSVRYTSLQKPQVGNSTSYAPSPTTYLYHDQYATNLAMHPYSPSTNNQGFTATHLRPVSFSQHGTSNASSHPSISVSNSSQPINSVMVAVDSRHHVSLHSPFTQNSGSKGSELTTPVSMPSNNTSCAATTSATNAVTTTFNSLQAQTNVNNHTSPRPSILRKRTSENVCSIAKKNLTDRLCAAEPASPRPDVSNNINFTSVLSPKPINDKVKEVLPPLIPASESQNLIIPVIPPSAIKKEPGIVENSCPMSESSTKDSKLMEASPRKKPRKQLLAANELMETHSSDGEENNFDVKMRIKEELALKDDEKSKYVTYYKRPSMSLLSSYRQSWKARHNHFARYSDVKPKEEKKPTVNELANQKGVLQHVNGWKVYHLTAQMDEVINLEESVYSRLTDLLDFVENDPPALRTRSLTNSDEDKILNKLTDLIKGNLQRSKIVQEQVSESKQQAIKVLDHKMNVVEMINKYISKRPLKKKEKT